ncbi:MAG: ATP-binding protein [Bacteriovoracaceae bacterium]|nr:ATP-binding protein [Bacteriovoracaceae bacterium]
MYIQRILQTKIINLFSSKNPKALILSGIVGCGKTTIIEHVLEHFKNDYTIFRFTGDDISFRNQIRKETTYIFNEVISHTTKKAMVFIDEVQKCEEVFDALKYAFDQGKISFIVSGSKPNYLSTVAKKRLQRRADFYYLQPLSLSEILADKLIISMGHIDTFYEVLVSPSKVGQIVKKFQFDSVVNQQLKAVIDQYLKYGGLPLAYLAKTSDEKLGEIVKVVERGFEPLSVDNIDLADQVRVELADLHCKEFSYQGIFQQSGIRKRDTINKTIDELINHGYLIKKTPFFFEKRRSYLSVYSYIDPGIVTYLTGNLQLDVDRGYKIEGLVHARIHSFTKLFPLKSKLSYYKPYIIQSNNNVKFKQGEIDFIFQYGKTIIPIEVKASFSINNIKAPLLETFIQDSKVPFGIILYGGLPFWSEAKRVLYWPFWLI